MFEVKVKTLDGRNTTFSVEDEITVAEFKEKISEKVNISVDRQRLIFTGKVLTDANTLKSYNVADKVIHVVNRLPPVTTSDGAGTSGASNAATTSAPTSGNRPSVSMSSVPSNMIGDVMNSVMSGLPSFADAMVHHIDLRRSHQGAPQHTESGRRVVLIRQWIRDAHSLLDRIRHPALGTRLSADSQTTEARNASLVHSHLPTESISVHVSTSSGLPTPAPPAASSQPRTTANATPATATRTSAAPAVRQPGTATGAMPTSANQSQGAARPTPTPRSQSQRAAAAALQPVNPHVEVLSSLWGEVDALQGRLHPHMHNYRDLLNAPSIGCPGHNQHLYDTISSVTHTLAHIYHSLSDLSCDFRSEANRELTALAAPAPPPTAIIQQTIPVTIPVRATLNVSPRTARRNRTTAAERGSGSTSTGGSDGRPPTGQQQQSGAGSGETASGRIFTSIELDMETDSGEDISEDGNSGPAPPHPEGAGGAMGGLSIPQLIQDALSGISGLAGMQGMSAGTTPSSSTPAAPATPAAPSASATPAGVTPNTVSGAFEQFMPPLGAATPGNGPIIAGGPLPPGFPAVGGSPAPRDRHDPYLANCPSTHWSQPQPTGHGHSHPAGPRTPPRGTPARGTPASNTASRGAATRTSQRPSSNTAQPRTSSRTTSSSRTSQTTSTASTSSGSTSTTSRSTSSPLQPEVLKRRFYEGISSYMTTAVSEQPWLGFGMPRVPITSSSELQQLNQRIQEIFRNASLNRAPNITIAELDRIIQEALPRPLSAHPSLGILGELCTLLFKDLTVTDLFQAYIGHGQIFDRLRAPLRRFARSNVLQDGPHTNENMGAAIDRLMVSIKEQINHVVGDIQCNGQYDVQASLSSFIREWLLEILNFIISSKEGTENFGQKLLDMLRKGIAHFLRLAYKLFDDATDSRTNWQLSHHIIAELIEYCTHSRRVLGQALKNFVLNYFEDEGLVGLIESFPMDTVSDHLIRAASSDAARVTAASPMQTDLQSTGSSDYQDAEPNASQTTNLPSSSSNSPTVSPLTTSSLSEASAADWRTVIPADWLPIIEEDIKKQLRLEANLSEQPLSEAYLNGRPQKRRRLSEVDDDE